MPVLDTNDSCVKVDTRLVLTSRRMVVRAIFICRAQHTMISARLPMSCTFVQLVCYKETDTELIPIGDSANPKLKPVIMERSSAV